MLSFGLKATVLVSMEDYEEIPESLELMNVCPINIIQDNCPHVCFKWIRRGSAPEDLRMRGNTRGRE